MLANACGVAPQRDVKSGDAGACRVALVGGVRRDGVVEAQL